MSPPEPESGHSPLDDLPSDDAVVRASDAPSRHIPSTLLAWAATLVLDAWKPGVSLERLLERLHLDESSRARLDEQWAAGGPSLSQLPPVPPQHRRALAGRALWLGLRLGPDPEARAAALAAHIGLGAPTRESLLAALRTEAGLHPIGADNDRQWTALTEFIRPSEGVRAILGDHRSPRPSVAAVPVSKWRHPDDIQATRAVQQSLPFGEAVRWLSATGVEPVLDALAHAGHIRVGPRQAPELYETYQQCAARLGVRPVPPLYLAHGGLNAVTMGIERPHVVLYSGLVQVLSQPELEFVIGHELGHVLCEHVLYLTLAQMLRLPGQLFAGIPVVGPVLQQATQLVLYRWQRQAELSCDRAGLLANQDLDAGLRLMMRTAGAPIGLAGRMDPHAWTDQYSALDDTTRETLLGRLSVGLATATRTHPWAVVRAHELREWARSGHYEGILDEAVSADAVAGAGLPTPLPCPVCGTPTVPDEPLCLGCGAGGAG